MKVLEASRLRDTALSIFARKGRVSRHVRPYDKDRHPSHLLDLGVQEYGILVSVQNINEWSVLTTHRMLFCPHGRTEDVPYTDIRSVLSESLTGLDKDVEDSLVISREPGEDVLIRLDPGLALSGYWSVLLYLTRMWQRSLDSHDT